MRLLVVDDGDDGRLVLKDLLEANGYQVETAADGAEALAAARREPPEMIISDIMMPTMDGFALCRALKEEPGLQAIPFLFYSATYVTDEDRELGLALGASRYLTKPMEPAALLVEIETMARELSAGRERVPEGPRLDPRELDRRYQRVVSRKLDQKVEALRDADAVLRAQMREKSLILDSAGEGILGLDSRGDHTFVNPAAARLLGYSQEELIGRPGHAIWHHSLPDGTPLPLTSCRICAVLRDGRAYSGEEYFVRRDGSFVPVAVHVAPIVVGDARPTGLVVSFTDISARKEEERQRRLGEERLRLVMQLNNEASDLSEQAFFDRALEIAVKITASHVGYLHRINEDQRTIALTSWSRETLAHCSVAHDTHYPLDKAGVWADSVRRRRVVVHNDYPALEERRGYPLGHFPVFRHMSVPMLSGDQVRMVLGVGNKEMPYDEFDATQLQSIGDDIMKFLLRREAEERLRQAKEQAERASRAKGEFLAMMSHELRTPLNAIMGMGELLEESPLNEEQRDYLATAQRAGHGLLAVIDDVLTLAGLDAGMAVAEEAPFDLDELLGSVVDSFAHAAESKGLSLVLECDEGVARERRGDPAKLRQILLNLVGNGIKFTARGGVELMVSVAAGERVAFAVSDSGIGIPEQERDRIFHPFTQLDSSYTRQYGGTGMGLTLAASLVELLGGEMAVESEPGRGSRFSFALALACDGRERPVKAPPEPIERREEGLSILLAEDAEDNAVLVEAYLGKTPHRLELVGDGFAAVEAFRDGVYDLVLMDIQMPVMDGYEATRAIRGWERERGRRPTPIVALTAHALKEDQQRSIGAGCDAHLTKPIKKRQLLDAIERYGGA